VGPNDPSCGAHVDSRNPGCEAPRRRLTCTLINRILVVGLYMVDGLNSDQHDHGCGTPLGRLVYTWIMLDPGCEAPREARGLS
jgi:hypothetical protein